MASMTEAEERRALLEELRVEQEILDREYADDCKKWVHEQVRTIDEATQTIRPWPDNKPYLDELFDLYETEQLIAIPKSRRLMVSYSVAAWAAWRCRYWPHNAIYVQSDKEEKSAYLIDQRCKFIEDHLIDDWCKRKYGAIRTKNGMVGRMTYDITKSYIVGVAQGADKIRSYTASALIMDESEFQKDAHQALDAATSLIEDGKNVKLILVSTSNGPEGVIARICKEVGFVKWG